MTTHKKIFSIILIMLFLAVSNIWADQTTNNAADNKNAGWTLIQLSAWDNLRWLHVFPTDWDVYGMRLSVPNAGNISQDQANVYGIDLGCISVFNQFGGIAMSMLGAVGNDVYGLIAGCLLAGGDEKITGVALSCGVVKTKKLNGIALAGLVTICEDVTGIQGTCFWNEAKKVKGIQLSPIINRAESGLQIGFFNFNKNGFLPVCPLINF